jgi:hypothetical protein
MEYINSKRNMYINNYLRKEKCFEKLPNYMHLKSMFKEYTYLENPEKDFIDKAICFAISLSKEEYENKPIESYYTIINVSEKHIDMVSKILENNFKYFLEFLTEAQIMFLKAFLKIKNENVNLTQIKHKIKETYKKEILDIVEMFNNLVNFGIFKEEKETNTEKSITLNIKLRWLEAYLLEIGETTQ